MFRIVFMSSELNLVVLKIKKEISEFWMGMKIWLCRNDNTNKCGMKCSYKNNSQVWSDSSWKGSKNENAYIPNWLLL